MAVHTLESDRGVYSSGHAWFSPSADDESMLHYQRHTSTRSRRFILTRRELCLAIAEQRLLHLDDPVDVRMFLQWTKTRGTFSTHELRSVARSLGLARDARVFLVLEGRKAPMVFADTLAASRYFRRFPPQLIKTPYNRHTWRTSLTWAASLRDRNYDGWTYGSYGAWSAQTDTPGTALVLCSLTGELLLDVSKPAFGTFREWLTRHAPTPKRAAPEAV